VTRVITYFSFNVTIEQGQFKIIGEDSLSINVIVHNINQDIFMDNGDNIH